VPKIFIGRSVLAWTHYAVWSSVT